jgi:DNA-binding transcriptional MerR regulator
MNVGQVAAAAGISVRTLHHWDSVGLLRPSGRTASGYRSYAEPDLERLQQVLTYRQLGFALADISALLDDPSIDTLDHLRRQQELLAERITRLQSAAALVRRAVEAKRMDMSLDPHELREVFGDDDPTQYAEQAQQRWGSSDAWASSQARAASYGKQDWLRIRGEAEDVERRFAAALAAGVPPDNPAVAALVEEHRRQICRFYEADAAMHRRLADMYVADERFRAHYDAVAPGLAQYVHDAVHAGAGKH